MNERFILSSNLKQYLKKSSTRATVNVQLTSAIPQPQLQTQASQSPQTTLLVYSREVFVDGAVGYWVMGPSYEGDIDLVPFYGILPHSKGSILTSTTLYGYLLTPTGFINYTDGAISAIQSDPAINFPAGMGAIINYFPVTGSESLFPGSLGYDTTEDFTWEFWIRTIQNPGSPVLILEQASGGVYPYKIQMVTGGFVKASRSDGTNSVSVTSSFNVNDSDWHYVTVIKDGSTFKVQIDENAESTVIDSLTNTTLLTVNGTLATDGFSGDIDELALYPLALSSENRSRHIAASIGAEVPV